MRPGRETAAGFFVARCVTRSGSRHPRACRYCALSLAGEGTDRSMNRRLRPCPVFVLLCPVIQGRPPSPNGREAAPTSCFLLLFTGSERLPTKRAAARLINFCYKNPARNAASNAVEPLMSSVSRRAVLAGAALTAASLIV